MRAVGTTDVVLEATSHALEQGRLDGCRFRVAALTNLTQDHLDYHGTMERLRNAKAILFERLIDPVHGVGVTFADDGGGAAHARAGEGERDVDRRTGAGREARGADVVVERHLYRAARDACHVRDAARHAGDRDAAGRRLQPRQPGAGRRDGDRARPRRRTRSSRGLARLPGVPGRLERVANERGVLCLVDYAHTPDALARAIAAVRPLVTSTSASSGARRDASSSSSAAAAIAIAASGR